MVSTLTDKIVKVEQIERELVVADRCDRCGAQAFMQFIWESEGLDLLFCAHHGKRFTPLVDLSKWVVLDSSNRLNEKPTDPSPDQF
jgi:hypothetical protein